MNEKQSEAIMEILYEHLETSRASTLQHYRMVEYLREGYKPREANECRIQGKLGFGCKLRLGPDGEVWVDYYPENRSLECDALQDKVNFLIQNVLKENCHE